MKVGKKDRETVAIIGLGYVGLPLAVAFSNKYNVIGFDIDDKKIEMFKQGHDVTNEIGCDILEHALIDFTTDENKLNQANIFIITVPTPIYKDLTPDISCVVKASNIVGRHISLGSVVIYESTVVPGFTRVKCKKILEDTSGYNCGSDFYLGYSPERINPGDKVHTLQSITKIISGINTQSTEKVYSIYKSIIGENIHIASTIEIAEAAKLIENCQRDVNIAFMNEIALYLNKKKIDTHEVISAMNTKWNALQFYPGLVGGHCVGVDPYYLIDDAKNNDCHYALTETSRSINNSIGNYIAGITMGFLVDNGISIENSKIGILGCTFKENCSDVRNSRVFDIVDCLKNAGAQLILMDPRATHIECDIDIHKDYGILKNLDCIIISVAHNEFKNLCLDDFKKMYRNDTKIFIDVKGLFYNDQSIMKSFIYWKL